MGETALNRSLRPLDGAMLACCPPEEAEPPWLQPVPASDPGEGDPPD
jgi:hypothetical protein